jgi:hypothetical protein
MLFAARPSPAREDSAAEILIIAGFRFRKNLGRMVDQHVQAIKNSSQCRSALHHIHVGSTEDGQGSVYSIHRGSLGWMIEKRN